MMKKNKNNKIKRALLYLVMGTAIIFIETLFIIYMYFSGTFLPYRHFERYTLYALSFIIILIAFWFANQGYQYIARRLRKRKRH